MKEKVNNQVLFDQVRHGSSVELVTETINNDDCYEQSSLLL